MAREYVLKASCDLCGRGAGHEGVRIEIGHRVPRTMDLCDRHYREIIQPVLDAMIHGVAKKPRKERQRGTKRTVGPYQCKLCVAAPLKNATTLEVHLRRLHDVASLEEYVERFGQLVPLTPEEAAEPVDVECEIEGCGQVYSTALGNRWPQMAMVSHMRGRHGISWRPGQDPSNARPSHLRATH